MRSVGEGLAAGPFEGDGHSDRQGESDEKDQGAEGEAQTGERAGRGRE